MLSGKHILVGISGGIAAYKIPELIRMLIKAGAEVRVTTTRHALEFVTELTLRTLSGAPVYSDVFAAINAHATEHISLPDWADLMIVAPATANVLGKMAAGIADDALTTTFAAMRKPVVVAPAMNDKMYLHPATQQAMQTLAAYPDMLMMDCVSGDLACGTNGKGRMAEPEQIMEAVRYALTPKTLSGKRIMLTAGPTQEKLDPVRYLSNYSTGKMGYALAREAWYRGAEVTLISGPTHLSIPALPALTTLPALNLVSVGSASEMYEASMQHFSASDAAVMCAAVADYAPQEESNVKIKRTEHEIQLPLRANKDIAAALGERKQPHQTVVGFALETDHEEQHALDKLAHKHLDWLVLNSLRDAGAGFGTDTNKVTIFSSKGQKKECPLLSKEAIATCIWDTISL